MDPTEMLSLRLLEFANFNNLVLTNTMGSNKLSRKWTWHRSDRKHQNQIDYILVKKRFHSGVNVHRSFSGADIGSHHDLLMMTFQIQLKKTKKPTQSILRFDFEKLRNPDVASTFQATIHTVGKFAPLIHLRDDDIDINMITIYNTAVTDTAIKKECHRKKKPWVTRDVLNLFDERRDLEKSNMKKKE